MDIYLGNRNVFELDKASPSRMRSLALIKSRRPGFVCDGAIVQNDLRLKIVQLDVLMKFDEIQRVWLKCMNSPILSDASGEVERIKSDVGPHIHA